MEKIKFIYEDEAIQTVQTYEVKDLKKGTADEMIEVFVLFMRSLTFDEEQIFEAMKRQAIDYFGDCGD